jgi:hypothetical protein
MSSTEQQYLADVPLPSSTPARRRRYLSPNFLKARLAEKGVVWCLKKAVRLPVKLMYRAANMLTPEFSGLRVQYVSRIQALAWMLYPRFLRWACLLKGYWGKEKGELARVGLAQSALSLAVAKRFLQDLKKVRPQPIVAGDCDDAYVGNPGVRQIAPQMNANFGFLALQECPAETIMAVLQELKKPVSECLGTPWRVVNVKSWRTNPFASEFGMNGWHTDGFPFAALKIMVYVSGAGKTTGTTEIRLSDGSAKAIEGVEGTWILFKNSELLHRGTAPQVTGHVRTILEITIAPAWKHGLDLVFAGLQASFPAYPWAGLIGRRSHLSDVRQAA